MSIADSYVSTRTTPADEWASHLQWPGETSARTSAQTTRSPEITVMSIQPMHPSGSLSSEPIPPRRLQHTQQRIQLVSPHYAPKSTLDGFKGAPIRSHDLIDLLESSFPPLVFDTRERCTYVNKHIKDSIHLHQSTIGSLESGKIEDFISTLCPKEQDKWKSASHIVFVNDESSSSSGANSSKVMAKFTASKSGSKIMWLANGFSSLKSYESSHPALFSSMTTDDGGGSRPNSPFLVNTQSTSNSSSSGSASATPVPILPSRPNPIAKSTSSSSSSLSKRRGLQFKNLPMDAFQRSTAFVSSGARSSIPPSTLCKENIVLPKRRKSSDMVLGKLPGKCASNPFFDNIRQNQEALSLERSLSNLSPFNLPPYTPDERERMPRFLSKLLSKTPIERASYLSRQYYELELAEKERLEGSYRWHATNSKSGKENESCYEKYSVWAGFELGALNRHRNIFPFDHTRVRLKEYDPGATDYINASHVSLQSSPLNFIASQGPLDSTYHDFWQMCDQENVGVIIMLTNLHEGGREKCGQYWKESGNRHWDVKLCDSSDNSQTKEEEGGFFTRPNTSNNSTIRRLFEIQKLNSKPGVTNPKRRIRHIQYCAWPDFDLPASASEVVDLVEEVNKAQKEYLEEIGWKGEKSPPILAHCSAGVGRTGVFIMVNSILERFGDLSFTDFFSSHSPMEIDGEPTLSPALMSPTSSLSALSLTTSPPTTFSNRSISASSHSFIQRKPEDDIHPLEYESTPALESDDPIYKGVNELRKMRMSMVATYPQYACVHECVVEGLLRKIRSKPA